MRNHPTLAMAAETTFSDCQCQDFTFDNCRKSLKDKHLPPPPLFSVDYDLFAPLKSWLIASLMRGCSELQRYKGSALGWLGSAASWAGRGVEEAGSNR